MREVRAFEDVYPAMDELVAELKAAGELRLAAILHHRMRQVAWTARSELFEELQNILTETLESDETTLPQLLRERMDRVLAIIISFLKAVEK